MFTVKSAWVGPVVAGFLALVVGCGAAPQGVRHAQTLMEKGDYTGAERAADTELARFPKHPVLWRIKIQAPLERGDSTQAVKRYKQWHHIRKHYDETAMRAMAVTTLDHALRASAAEVRRSAVRAVARMSDKRLRVSLAKLLDDKDETVAAATAVVLAAKNKRALATAERLLKSANDSARATAVIALGRVAKRRQVAVAALKDKAPRVRRAGVSALSSLEGSATAELTAVAKSDADGTVRASALQALARRKLDSSLTLAKLALADKYVGSRLAAIGLLRHSGKEGQDLLLGLTNSADAFVALRAAVALVHLSGKRRPGAVDRALNSSEWTVRAAALNALGEVVEKPEAIRLARRALTDVRVEVRLTAARALARNGLNGAAMGVFQTALNDARESIRIQGAIQLLRLDEGSGRRALAKLLRSKNVSTRTAAVRAYSRADNATLTLIAALADKAPEVRVVAAESLIRLLR